MDSLSQMLSMGNVHPGGKYLVVDDASGIVVTAVIERLGGNHAGHTSLQYSDISSKVMDEFLPSVTSRALLPIRS